MDGFDRFFAVWFYICAVLGIAITGVLIWAISTLINHFT